MAPHETKPEQLTKETVDAPAPIHKAQVLTYLRLTRLTLGLLNHPSNLPSRPSHLRG